MQRKRELRGLEATRPYYAHLLRMEQQLPADQQCAEFQEALQAHIGLDLAVEACKRPGATEEDALRAMANLAYASAVCDGPLDSPPDTTPVLVPFMAPLISQSGGQLVVQLVLPTNNDDVQLPLVLKMSALILGTFLSGPTQRRTTLTVSAELATLLEATAARHAAWDLELLQLGSQLTLRLLRYLATRQAHVYCRLLMQDGQVPPGAIASLRASGQSLVEFGVRPARAHSELAQALLMQGQGYERDLRGMYEHQLRSRAAAAEQGSPTGEALGCFEAAIAVMSGAVGRRYRRSIVEELLASGADAMAKARVWEPKRSVAHMKDARQRVEKHLDQADRCTPQAVKDSGFLMSATVVSSSDVWMGAVPDNGELRLTELPSMICDACGEPMVKPCVCAACKKARYCNRACQTRGWPTHKAACKQAQRDAAGASGSGGGEASQRRTA